MSEKIALEGGTPLRTRPFPAWPIVGPEEEQLVVEVVRSGKWGAMQGPWVKQFEERFAAFQEARYGSCVSTGTMGLMLALKALGVGPGDEVIVPPYTFIATASAALMVGAVPVFVDVDPETFMLDASKIEAAITKRTKAIVVVHLGGCPADMDAVTEAAKKHGIALLEDAAQAHGAAWRGRKVGAIGDVGMFSFQASKNISGGDAGILVTNDQKLGDLIWSLHNVGRLRQGGWYQHEVIGWNVRITQLQAAVMLPQLDRLPAQIIRREANGAYLAARFSEIPGLTPLQRDPRVTTHAWHLFCFKYDPAAFGDRSKADFCRAMEAEGIYCSTGYVGLNNNAAILREIGRIRGESVPAPTPCPVSDTSPVAWMPQNVLLGEKTDMDEIAAAAARIQHAWGR